MGKKSKICEIKTIVKAISEVNSKNEQKVLAVASWNGREDTIDIRRYNIQDEVLLKGISLTPQEAEELLYALLESGEINIDRERVRQILDKQEQSEVDVSALAESLDETDIDGELEEVTYGAHKRSKCYPIRISVKKKYIGKLI